LVLNESFDDPKLNANVWNTQFRWGASNPPELQLYTPDALSIDSGVLKLTADKKPSGKFSYSSGMIASYDRFYFQYGYIEYRAKVPKGQGLWLALWLLAQDPNSAAEIDVMELIGQEPNRVHMTVHYGSSEGDKGSLGTSVSGPDYSQDFHTYAVDWSWERIIWYIDGQEVYRTTDHVPHEPMYIIANQAVGGDWPGNPNQDTHFPADFEIDYIRVYAP
jgi:beta-glucanase (GH16 family)